MPPRARSTPRIRSPAYVDAARARLVPAHAAYEVSELVRAAVPVARGALRTDGGPVSAGATLADAADVLAAARRLLEAAVVYERVGGADWQRVGAALGVPGDVARDLFAAAEARRRTELRRPGAARGSWWRAHALEAPHAAARDLDEWVLRHADGEHGLGAAPVSGGLESAASAAPEAGVTRAAAPPPPAERAPRPAGPARD